MTSSFNNSSTEELLDVLDKRLDQLNDLTVQITEIPAPPFKEAERGKFVKEKFDTLGYTTTVDDIGNVYAYLGELNLDSKVVVSAHLDTVFPDENITVVRKGNKLMAPGIGDDSRGLANLILIAELLKSSNISTSIVYIATVGEEGLGDLRGVKAVFDWEQINPEKMKIFLTIDGTGTNSVVDQGIGSRRYIYSFSGPGGHSYGAFGTVNPSYAVGEFLSNVGQIEVPKPPRTTYSIGVISGGSSINAIPEQIDVSIDIRSEVEGGIKQIEQLMKQYAENGIAIENERSEGSLELSIKRVGDRPPGMLPKDSWVRKVIDGVHSSLDLEVKCNPSSTDANVALSKEIPALGITSVAEGGRAHSQDEWIKADMESLIPVKRNLLLIVKLVQYGSRT